MYKKITKKEHDRFLKKYGFKKIKFINFGPLWGLRCMAERQNGKTIGFQTYTGGSIEVGLAGIETYFDLVLLQKEK